MTVETQKIQCPNCATDIDVSAVLSQQLEAELKQQYQQQSEKFQKLQQQIEADKQTLQQQQDNYKKNLDEAVQQQLKTEQKKLEIQIKSRLESEQAEQIKAMQQELQEKSEQVKALNKSKAEIERLKRENAEQKEKIELELQQKLTEQLNQQKEQIQKTEQQKVAMQMSEREKVIQQLKEQLTEAQRKAEQGSMQLQGEVQELAIEDWLAAQFPLDTIEEIKKGQRGADCLQTVNTNGQQAIGSIYYESKRTKAFQSGWIEKFKIDIQEKNANIGVLVTEAMPSDMPRMGLKDGIWVCSFEDFKGLCLVLRESVIQVGQALASQENKGEKMTMLYDFLTSNEFRLQIEAIVEGFTQMKTDLESEQRAMQKLWKKREKQIDKVLLNTTYMYGSIKGIAGNAVESVALLELNSEEVND